MSNSNQHGLIKKREYKITCKLNTVRNKPKKKDRLLNWRLDPYVFISTNLFPHTLWKPWNWKISKIYKQHCQRWNAALRLKHYSILSCKRESKINSHNFLLLTDLSKKKKKNQEENTLCQHHHLRSSPFFTDLSLSRTSLLMAFKVKSHGAMKITQTAGDI